MKKYLFLVIFVFIFLGIISTFRFYSTQPQKLEPKNNSFVTITQKLNKSITYKGKAGIDALTLLKELNSVEQDKSGLVTTINEISANSQRKEYWAFYVNGKMAQVGPADYITNTEDRIEWRLESY